MDIFKRIIRMAPVLKVHMWMDLSADKELSSLQMDLSYQGSTIMVLFMAKVSFMV